MTTPENPPNPIGPPDEESGFKPAIPDEIKDAAASDPDNTEGILEETLTIGYDIPDNSRYHERQLQDKEEEISDLTTRIRELEEEQQLRPSEHNLEQIEAWKREQDLAEAEIVQLKGQATMFNDE